MRTNERVSTSIADVANSKIACVDSVATGFALECIRCAVEQDRTCEAVPDGEETTEKGPTT